MTEETQHTGRFKGRAHGLNARLMAWLQTSSAYKARWISAKIIYYCSSVVLRALHGGPFGKRIFQAAYFDRAPSSDLLISNGPSERFVVAAGDKRIGKSVFVTGEPFDFDKLELGVKLLGAAHKKTVLIDIGANIGTICISAVRRGLFERAIAIEPEPLNYALLSANVFINNVADRIEIRNTALGANNGELLSFELSSDNYGDHRIRGNDGATMRGEASRKTMEVKSDTFDYVVGEVDPAGTLMWMDTQGFEGYILAGASNALKNRTPICLEFWPRGLDRTGCYPSLKHALVSHGYVAFYDMKNPSLGAVPLSEQSLDELYRKLGRDGGDTDLLVI